MVSIGTIFTIAVIGATAVGVYAVSRNTQQIGGAFTRGAESLVAAPLSKYLNSLFKNLPSIAPTPTPQQTQPKPLTNPTLNQPNPWSAPTNPTLIDDKISKGIQLPFPTDTTDPNLNLGKFQPKKPSAGYYYLNYVGAAAGYDRQQYLSKSQAAKWIQGINVDKKGGLLQNIKFLGSRRISDRGFRLIGQANNYL